MKNIFYTFGALFILSSCGFTPIHGTAFQDEASAQSLRSEMAQVQIENIPNREGQFLRNELIDRLYRDGRPSHPKYSLVITPIGEKKSDLDITKESDATRSQLKLRTSMQLIDIQTKEVVISRKLNAISSYNVLSSEFATRVSEQNTRENALNDIARQVELHIGLYLKR